MILIVSAGCGIDYAGAAKLRTKLQGATDMTVLAISKSAPAMSDEEVRTLATKMLQTQLNDAGAKVETVALTEGRQRIDLTTSADYKTAFLGIIGFAHVPVQVSSASFTSSMSHEIALVIDNSGSMNASAGGASKMQSAKEAAGKLIDAMMSTQAAASNTKISVIPFTLSVKVGSEYASASWMDRTGASSAHWNTLNLDKSTALSTSPVTSRFDLFSQLNTSWAGCVETRPGVLATTDTAASSGSPDTFFVPMFAPDEPGLAGATLYYPNSPGSWSTEWVYNNSYIDDDENTKCTTKYGASNYVRKEKMLCKYKTPPYYVTSYGRGPNYGCTAKPLLRLTSNKTSLHSAISGMTAEGPTNLLEGFTWGWRTLSPNTPFAEGKAYSVVENRKIIILLTDGMNAWGSENNHNKSQYSSFGFYTDNRIASGVMTATDARMQMDARTLEACTNAKAQGVRVYTVGFSVSSDPIDSDGLNLLRACASSSSMAYVANDSSAIIAVFEEIARNVSSLRIAR